jgi:hypothetical protein
MGVYTIKRAEDLKSIPELLFRETGERISVPDLWFGMPLLEKFSALSPSPPSDRIWAAYNAMGLPRFVLARRMNELLEKLPSNKRVRGRGEDLDAWMNNSLPPLDKPGGVRQTALDQLRVFAAISAQETGEHVTMEWLLFGRPLEK